MSRRMRIALFVACAVAAGCGVDTGESSDGIESHLEASTAAYLELDIASGTTRYVLDVGDGIDDPTYRRSKILFVRVDGGSMPLGQDVGTAGLQPGEAPAWVGATGPYWIACFELTQAQWRALGGGSPWADVGAELVGADAVGADRPAFNLGFDELAAVLDDYRGRTGRRLALPSPERWEHACRAGGGTFAWGDEMTAAAATDRALVHETAGGVPGPDPVGIRAANRFGLYDAHGNVWEWVEGREIRGGSWHDLLTHARAANRVDLSALAGGHPLVGARLVLEVED